MGENISDYELSVIEQFMRACAQSSLFDDDEFETLFGVDRDELKLVLRGWPIFNPQDEVVHLSVNNSIVQLLGYPHDEDFLLSDYVDVPASEGYEILKKWKRVNG